MRQTVLIALFLLLSIIAGQVLGFPKRLEKSVDENNGASLKNLPEKVDVKVSDSLEDELVIAYRILERVPLIDGFVPFAIHKARPAASVTIPLVI